MGRRQTPETCADAGVCPLRKEIEMVSQKAILPPGVLAGGFHKLKHGRFDITVLNDGYITLTSDILMFGSDKIVVRSPSGNRRVDETIMNVNVVK
jgi:hypothetical protein